MTVTRDDAGAATRSTCTSWLGEPMRDKTGVVAIAWERDRSGLATVERYVDAAGDPVAAADGVHRHVTERDGDGRPIRERSYGLDGEPALSASTRAHGVARTYDDRNLQVRRTRLAADGKPKAKGVAEERYVYDADGCMVEDRSFTDEGEAAEWADGVHSWRYVPSVGCDETEKRCIDDKGYPTPCGPSRPAREVKTYDESGYLISRKHYDAAGQPGQDKDYEVFERRWERDDVGRAIRTSCHDTTGAPVQCASTGFHAVRHTYDDAGRNTASTFEDGFGKPTDNMGTWRREKMFDAYDHLYETRNLDAGGKPVAAYGLASTRRLYDEGHKLFGLLLFGPDGKAARYTACFTGQKCPSEPWHAVAILRGEDGRATENVFFDAERQKMLTLSCSESPCWK